MLYRLEKSKIKFLLVFKENKFIGYITPIMLKTEIQSFGLEYQTSSEKITYQYQSLYKEKILSFKQLNSSFKIINKDNVIEVYKEEKKTEREHDVDNVLIFCGGKE